jgi:predicted GTPase
MPLAMAASATAAAGGCLGPAPHGTIPPTREEKVERTRIVIMGAAGRDFHNFNLLCRNDPGREVVAFTAAQIPDIAGRSYPPELAGERYPQGIPIHPEEDLERIVREQRVHEVWFCYSDVDSAHVMARAARATAAGASFVLCSARDTMLASTKPVMAVTAIRTGVGKSQTTRYLTRILRQWGHRVAVVRHPMPYGDLRQQIWQRYETYDDLERHETTIEEREEYEPHIDNGCIVYAGVDYAEILRRAEAEADVVLWDGGNNDTPFYRPDLHLVLLDPHRAGHELTYYPGFTNLLMADLLLVNKVQTAPEEGLRQVLENAARHNPGARVIQCNSKITVDRPELIAGKRALVVEDGPTLTHGGMEYGAGWYAALEAGAAEIVEPLAHAQGSLVETYAAYPNARRILPAMGYGEAQIRDLEATIRATPADVVVAGTPIDLSRVLRSDKPIAKVRYELEERQPGEIAEEAARILAAFASSGGR